VRQPAVSSWNGKREPERSFETRPPSGSTRKKAKKDSHRGVEEIGFDFLRTRDQSNFSLRPVFRVDIASCYDDADLLDQIRQDRERPTAPVRAGGDHPCDRLIRDRATVAQRELVLFQPSMQIVQDQTGLNVCDGLVADFGDGERGGKGVGPDLPGRCAGEV
jgi:hypothetical protein